MRHYDDDPDDNLEREAVEDAWRDSRGEDGEDEGEEGCDTPDEVFAQVPFAAFRSEAEIRRYCNDQGLALTVDAGTIARTGNHLMAAELDREAQVWFRAAAAADPMEILTGEGRR